MLHPEWHYTNKNTIEFFRDNYNLKKDHVLSGQLVCGIICMQNNSTVQSFFDTFFEIIDKDHDLITLKYDAVNPLEGFIMHRYDQSILSLLSKATNVGYIIPDETYPNNPKFLHYFSEKIFRQIKDFDDCGKFPILATRSRQ